MSYTVSGLKRRINNYDSAINKLQKLLGQEMSNRNKMGRRLIESFVKFVNENPDLYDQEFIGVVNGRYDFVEILINDDNKCFDIYVYYGDVNPPVKKKIVIPFLLIRDEKEYALKRYAAIALKGKSADEIGKIYDDKVEDLLGQIKELNREKNLILK